MGYQVLARKWRPHDFREVVGQQHVLTALVNSLDQGRLHHAWLFSGTRGVGKTTIARILAKCLNCEQGVSSTPCGQCDSCREIDQGNFVDLLEIDAASRTKVEDTRELLENVQYRPARGRFKVYLIDEVHMLSRHSFNALLKTLEEPPPYVKFLLATTDPQKLPITILSRCLQFHLKALSREQIVGQLQSILDAEGQPYEPPALLALAKAADGSMRDALSLTDQALAHGNGHVRLDLVQGMLGTLDQRHLHAVLRLLAAGQGSALMQKVAELAALGPDFDLLHADLAALLHRMALAQMLGADPDPLALDGEQVTQLAQQYSAEEIQLCYQIVLQGRRELPLAPDGRSALEMTLLRMLAFSPRRVVLDVPSLSGGLSRGEPTAAVTIRPEPTLPASAMPAAQLASNSPLPATGNVPSETASMAAAPRPMPHTAPADVRTAEERANEQMASRLADEQSHLLDEAALLRAETPQMPGRPSPAVAASANMAPPPMPAENDNTAAASSALSTTLSLMQMRNQMLGQPQPAGVTRAVPDASPAEMPARRPVTGLASAVQPQHPPVNTLSTSAPVSSAFTAPASVPPHPVAPVSAPAPMPTSAPAMEPATTQVDDLPPWELPPLSAYDDEMGVSGASLSAPVDDGLRNNAVVPTKPPAPLVATPATAHMNAVPSAVSAAATVREQPGGLPLPDSTDETATEPGAWRPWQSNDLLTGCGDPWAELIATCGIGGRLRQLALQSSREIKPDHWLLTIPAEHRHLVSDRAIAALAEQLSAHAEAPVQLQLQIGVPQGLTPLQIEHARYEQICEQARRSLADDPHIQFLIERFGAQLEADSIQPLTQSDDNSEER